jgi:phosphoglycolate phosphatase
MRPLQNLAIGALIYRSSSKHLQFYYAEAVVHTQCYNSEMKWRNRAEISINQPRQKTDIFDFDGTIALTLQTLLEIFNEVGPRYGLPKVLDSDINTIRGMSARTLLKMYPLPPHQLLLLIRTMKSQLKMRMHEVKFMEGLPEALYTLKDHGHGLGIITSNSEENVETFLDVHDLHLFNFIRSGRRLLGKDTVLRSVMKKQKLLLEDTTYVGDEIRDIDAARQAGIDIVSVTWGYNTLEALANAKPTFLVSTPQEMAIALLGK